MNKTKVIKKSCGTGWTIAETSGLDRVATMLWESMFAGGIAFSTGGIASILTNAAIESSKQSAEAAIEMTLASSMGVIPSIAVNKVMESIKQNTGLAEDTSVKE